MNEKINDDVENNNSMAQQENIREKLDQENIVIAEESIENNETVSEESKTENNETVRGEQNRK